MDKYFTSFEAKAISSLRVWELKISKYDNEILIYTGLQCSWTEHLYFGMSIHMLSHNVNKYNINFYQTVK